MEIVRSHLILRNMYMLAELKKSYKAILPVSICMQNNGKYLGNENKLLKETFLSMARLPNPPHGQEAPNPQHCDPSSLR